MEKKKIKYGASALLLVPMYITALLLVLGPLLYMVYLSFMSRGEVWGFVNEATLENYKALLEPLYMDTFMTSLKLALQSTGLIILIGYPFGYFMARLSETWKRRMMLLIMLPFWTSSLIRLYGWIIVFRSNGTLDKLLMGLGITDA
ncbi:MAG: spermidine/putrescine ABC transporter permease PotB, partial [Firmicutes bacterium]|nr:spermidine/putrescine ABC transporter permease PotB [Bacillota bacterium]